MLLPEQEMSHSQSVKVTAASALVKTASAAVTQASLRLESPTSQASRAVVQVV